MYEEKMVYTFYSELCSYHFAVTITFSDSYKKMTLTLRS